MSRPVVRIALPWLQAALAAAVAAEAAPTLAALRWLGGRGRFHDDVGVSWRAWLLEPVGGAEALLAAPAGPALAVWQGHAVDDSTTWCIAQPVHLSPGLDHLRMGALAAARPDAAAAEALAATVRAHFADDAPHVVGFVEGLWLLRFPGIVDCVTQPPDTVVGHDVHDAMPAGRDGARVRALMNELQMLLHEHPVNAARERVRQSTINGWWLWGFGTRMRAPAAAHAISLVSDDPWLRAIWTGECTAELAAAPTRETLIAVTEPPSADDAEALEVVDAGLLTRLVGWVREGSVGRIELLAGDRMLTIAGSARRAFWRRPVALARWLE